MSWLLVLALVSTIAVVELVSLSSIGNGLTKEINAVKQPLLETVVNVGSTQCENVKKLFGLEYSQLNGEREPDLDQLSLKYVTKALNVSININEAADLLTMLPKFLDQKLLLFIHGFTDDPTKGSFAAVSSAFLKKGSYTVLALDGSSLIHWLYLRSTTYVRFIGEKLGAILADMVDQGLPVSSIHILGHSLGAHIASFTGKEFALKTGGRLPRISGLDPAGPCFVSVDSELRLQQTDADFVDVIHTNGGVAGMRAACGHIDYYPNEGIQQPGCLLDTCSHGRSWEYFAESVNNEFTFPALQCADWDQFRKGQCNESISYMGLASSPEDAEGTYYLQTANTSPYGLYEKGIEYINNEGIIKTLLGKR